MKLSNKKKRNFQPILAHWWIRDNNPEQAAATRKSGVNRYATLVKKALRAAGVNPKFIYTSSLTNGVRVKVDITGIPADMDPEEIIDIAMQVGDENGFKVRGDITENRDRKGVFNVMLKVPKAPSLTDAPKTSALLAAIKPEYRKYYDEISIQDLAKETGLSEDTLQAEAAHVAEEEGTNVLGYLKAKDQYFDKLSDMNYEYPLVLEGGDVVVALGDRIYDVDLYEFDEFADDEAEDY